MPAQDLALSSVGKTYDTEDDAWKVKWIFRRSSQKIGGFTYGVARDLTEAEAAAWEQYSIRYAEQISAAWEAGDEERLENIIEEIEHAVSSERSPEEAGEAGSDEGSQREASSNENSGRGSGGENH